MPRRSTCRWPVLWLLAGTAGTGATLFLRWRWALLDRWTGEVFLLFVGLSLCLVGEIGIRALTAQTGATRRLRVRVVALALTVTAVTRARWGLYDAPFAILVGAAAVLFLLPVAGAAWRRKKVLFDALVMSGGGLWRHKTRICLLVIAGTLCGVGVRHVLLALPRLEFNFADTLFALATLTLALLLLGDAAARLLVSHGAFKSQFRLAVVVFMLSLTGAEAWLRFGWRVYASPEEDRSGRYTTYFPRIDQMKQSAIQRRYFLNPPHLATTVRFAEGTYQLRTNALGLRGPEVDPVPDSGTFRIIAVGDSYTEGFGVSEADAWPRQLEPSLHRRVPGLRVESINAGFAGSDPVFGSTLIEGVVAALRPSLVIQAMSSNDVLDICGRGGFERYGPDGSVVLRVGPRWEWLYGLSFVARHVVHDVMGYDRGLRTRSVSEECTAAARATLREAVDRSCRVSRAAGSSLVVVIHPMVGEVVSGHYELDDLWAAGPPACAHVLWLRHWFARQGITRDHVDDFYFPIDRHHNARGNGVFAEGVADHLVATGLLPPSP
jgi:lysophospholipase L1-like esterase